MRAWVWLRFVSCQVLCAGQEALGFPPCCASWDLAVPWLLVTNSLTLGALPPWFPAKNGVSFAC